MIHRYLIENKLYFYATGTNEKAFLNSTWKMSQKEVEKANGAELFAPKNQFTCLPPGDFTNPLRFKALSSEQVSLWGLNAEVTYCFFDDILYSYEISISEIKDDKLQEKITETLKNRFCEGEAISPKSAAMRLRHLWNLSNQMIEYAIIESDDKRFHNIFIKAQHKPLNEFIQQAARKERESYF